MSKPSKRRETGEQDFFRSHLDQMKLRQVAANRIDELSALADERAGSGNLDSKDKWNFCLTSA